MMIWKRKKKKSLRKKKRRRNQHTKVPKRLKVKAPTRAEKPEPQKATPPNANSSKHRQRRLSFIAWGDFGIFIYFTQKCFHDSHLCVKKFPSVFLNYLLFYFLLSI